MTTIKVPIGAPPVKPDKISPATKTEMPPGFTCEHAGASPAGGHWEPVWTANDIAAADSTGFLEHLKTDLVVPDEHKGWICRHNLDPSAYPDQVGQAPVTGGATGIKPPEAGTTPVDEQEDTTAIPEGPTATAVPPAPPAIPPTSIQRKLHSSFNPQCFLMDMATAIRSYKMDENNLLNGIKKNARVRQIGATGGFLSSYNTNLKYINKITLLSNIQNFFEITPNEAAQLAHYAFIKEVIRHQDSNTTRKSSIFPSTSNDELLDIGSTSADHDLFQSTGRRLGAGIKSIDVNYEGIDSATKKIISVKATFAFQDIRTMMSEPYVELFKLAKTSTIAAGGVEKSGSRTIDFELGWKSNPTLTAKLKLDSLKLKLQTHLVMYTFDLSQDGSIIVNATYRGHIVDVFSGPGSNILSLAKTSWEEIKSRQDEIEGKQVNVAHKALEAQRSALAMEEAGRILKEAFSLPPTGGGIPNLQNILKSIDDFQNVNLINGNAHGSARKDWEHFVSKASNAGSALSKLSHTTRQLTAKGIRASTAGGTSEGMGQAFWEDVQKEVYQRLKNLEILLQPPSAGGSTDEMLPVSAAHKAKSKQAVATLAQGDSNQLNSIEHLIEVGAANQNQAEANQATAADIAKQQQLREANKVKYIALRELAKQLLDSTHIHYAYVSRDYAEKFKIASATGGHSGVKSVMDTIIPADILTLRSLTEEEVSNEDYQVIPFIFFGKLIEQILELPVDRENGQLKGRVMDLMKRAGGSDFSVDMGYSSFEGPYSGSLHENFPLYYFPISLMKINNFIATEVLAKERTFFAFNSFVLSIIQKFFTSLFSICIRESHLVTNSAPKIVATVGTKDSKASGFYGLQYFIHGFKNVVNDIRNGGVEFGAYQSNFTNNIYHFYLGGQARGAVRTVKVSDIADSPSKTAIYFRPGASARSNNSSATEGGLQPAVFQAVVETMGFPLFNIGHLIYVDLRPFITEANGRQFKANGYYSVHKVSHSFTPESFTSKVDSILQFSRADMLTANVSGKPHKESSAELPEISLETAEQIQELKLEQEIFQKQQDWLKKYHNIPSDSSGNKKADAIKELGEFPNSGEIALGQSEHVDDATIQKMQRLEKYTDILTNVFVPEQRRIYDSQKLAASQSAESCAIDANGQMVCAIENTESFQQYLNRVGKMGPNSANFKSFAAKYPAEAAYMESWRIEGETGVKPVKVTPLTGPGSSSTHPLHPDVPMTP
jgi:hypothetical protein